MYNPQHYIKSLNRNLVANKELTDGLITLRDLIRWASSEFNRNQLTFGHGFANSLDEAVYLVLHALHLPFDWPETYFDTQHQQ